MTDITTTPQYKKTLSLLHKTIKKVTEDIEHLRFNTAISAMMILVKHLGALPAVPREALKMLVLVLSLVLASLRQGPTVAASSVDAGWSCLLHLHLVLPASSRISCDCIVTGPNLHARNIT